MSKKFRKALLATAAIASAAGALLYLSRKKAADETEDSDYDDFSDDGAGDSDSSRSYVQLNPDTPEKEETASPECCCGETAPAEEAPAEAPETESFTPLADQAPAAEEKTEEAVEEFFDEEDSSEEEPPIPES